MNLKQSFYGVLSNIFGLGSMVLMLLFGTYVIAFTLVELSNGSRDSYLRIDYIELIPAILSVLVSIFLLVIIIEWTLSKSPQFISIEDDKLVIRTLLTKNKFELAKCRTLKSKSLFNIYNYSIEVSINNKKKLIYLDQFRFKEFEKFFTFIESNEN